MLNCPQCKIPLRVSDLVDGRCPDCHASVSPNESGADNPSDDINESAQTIDLGPDKSSSDTAQTIDLPKNASTNVGNDTVERLAGHDLTISEVKPSNDEDSDKRIPPGEHPSQADQGTVFFPSQELPAVEAPSVEIDSSIQATWGGPSESAGPEMTIRTVGDDSDTDRGSKSLNASLVIQNRVITDDVALESPQPSELADYQLISHLGEGGMGVVYTARQGSIDRTVALKMLKSDSATDDVSKQKFLSEAVVTGELDHPNIVPIYDLGSRSDGTLFYSMKKIQGTPWLAVIRDKSLHENLDILMKVADAVAFAHSRGIIHRDLKPENVMLGDFGEVLVLDWGLAMTTVDCTKADTLPNNTSMGGTPCYMAPEMVVGPVEAIDKHSDIYLLGAILYDCVTGHPPHTGATSMLCLMSAGKNEIEPTEKSGELIEIARKAMATDPQDRYPSVQEFQSAVRDYQSHSESVALSARAQQELESAQQTDNYHDYAKALYVFEESYSLWNDNHQAQQGISKAQFVYAESAYRKGDFDLGLSVLDEQNEAHQSLLKQLRSAREERDARQARLHRAKRAVGILAATVFLAVSIGMVMFMIQKREADRQRNLALAQKQEADTQRNEAERQRTRALDQKQEADRQRVEADRQRNLAVTQKREADAQREEADRQRQSANEERAEAERQRNLALEQETIAKANQREAVTQRDIAQRKTREAEYEAYLAWIGLAAAKIDENALGQARQVLAQCVPQLRDWEWSRLAYQCRQATNRFSFGTRIECLSIRDDGQYAAVASRDGDIHLCRLDNGQVVAKCSLAEDYASALAFMPGQSSQLIIGAGQPSSNLFVWDWETDERTPWTGHSDRVTRISFSADGRRAVTSSFDETAVIWNVALSEPMHVLRGHTWWVWSAEFSADATQVVTASQDGTVRLWNAQTGEQRRSNGEAMPFRGHDGPVYAAVFSPDGRWIASGGYDNRPILWRPNDLQPFDFRRMLREGAVDEQTTIVCEGHTAAVSRLVFSTDGRQLVSASHDNSLKVWTATSQQIDGIDVPAGQLIKTLRGHNSVVRDAQFVPSSSSSIASVSFDGDLRTWNLTDYAEERTVPGVLLRGHVDAVLCSAFSADGRQIVTASRDRTARTWNVADGRALQVFREGHAYLGSRAIVFPQGRRVLTAAIDGTARVWSIDTGAEQFVLDGAGFQAAADISPNGKWIATGSDNVTANGGEKRYAARLWDAASGKLLAEYPGHRAQVTVVAFASSGKWLYSGDANGRGVIWNLETGDRLVTLRSHTDRISAADFLPDDSALLTASNDKTVLRWTLPDSDPSGWPELVSPDKDRTLLHAGAVTSLSVSPTGQEVLSADERGHVRLWDASNGSELWTWQGRDEANLNSVSFSPADETAIVVDARHNRLHLLNTANGSEILSQDEPTGRQRAFLELSEHDAIGWAATFTPDGTRILTVGGDEARLWDRQGVEHLSFRAHHTVTHADFSPNGQWLVTAAWDRSAKIWDVATGKARIKLADHVAGPAGGHESNINSAVFSRDGEFVLTASDDGTLKLWNANDGRVIRTYRGHRDAVLSGRFSHDGRRIVSTSRDQTCRIWPIEAEEATIVLRGHDAAVQCGVFSPDDQLIVTGGADNRTILWDAASGEPRRTLAEQTDEVTAVAVSPSGTRILTGCADHSVKLWDVSTGREIISLDGHSREVTSVSFSPDGRYALSSSRDGTAIIWPATPSSQHNSALDVEDLSLSP